MKPSKVILVCIWLVSLLIFGGVGLAFGRWRFCYGLTKSGVSVPARVTDIRTAYYGKHRELIAYWTYYQYEVQNRIFRGHQELNKKPQGPTIQVTYDSQNPRNSMVGDPKLALNYWLKKTVFVCLLVSLIPPFFIKQFLKNEPNLALHRTPTAGAGEL